MAYKSLFLLKFDLHCTIIVLLCLILCCQGKQNGTNEVTNDKLSNNTVESVETPKKEDEKQGRSPNKHEHSVETPRREESVETPKRDSQMVP
jgi:hypothetical protein